MCPHLTPKPPNQPKILAIIPPAYYHITMKPLPVILKPSSVRVFRATPQPDQIVSTEPDCAGAQNFVPVFRTKGIQLLPLLLFVSFSPFERFVIQKISIISIISSESITPSPLPNQLKLLPPSPYTVNISLKVDF